MREQQRNTTRTVHLPVMDARDTICSDWTSIFPEFRCWMCKRSKTRENKLSSNDRKLKKDAVDFLVKLVRHYSVNLLDLETVSAVKVLHILKDNRNPVMFVTILGHKLTVAQWCNRLGIDEIEMRRICELKDFEITKLLSDVVSERLNNQSNLEDILHTR